MTSTLSSVLGSRAAVPNFPRWMVLARVVVDIAASTMGQGLGLLIWMLAGDGLPQFSMPEHFLELYLVGEVFAFLSLVLFGLYTPQRSLLDLHENRQLLRAWLVALAGTRLLLYLMQIPVSNALLLGVWGAILPSLYFGRQLFHVLGAKLHRAGYGGTAALVYGAGELGVRLVRELHRTPERGIQVVGFLDDNPALQGEAIEGIPVRGDFFRLDGLLSEGHIRRIYIALPNVPRRTILDILAICRRHEVDFQIVPAAPEQILSLVELQDLDGFPLLARPSTELSPGPRLRKRILDLSLALPLLAITGPVLLVVAPLVRRSTGGSALVRIPVAGVGDKPFRLLRLRTMSVSERPELHRNPGDPRLTSVGRWMRRTLLEIAPELWNVVRGEMSMVGPRPLTLRESASLDPRHQFRRELPPGLTGLWKIDPRSPLEPQDELEMDLQYLRLRSFLLDITVILRSLDEILRRPPAI